MPRVKSSARSQNFKKPISVEECTDAYFDSLLSNSSAPYATIIHFLLIDENEAVAERFIDYLSHRVVR